MTEQCKQCQRGLVLLPDALDGQMVCKGCQSLPDFCECEPDPRRLVLTAASSIEPEPVIWAWRDNGNGRIPAGMCGLFAGREGTGKSSFLIWLVAQITRGTLPGTWAGKPRPVIYVAVEDSWKHTLVPRFIAAGANLDLIFRAEVQVIEGDTVSLVLPLDLRRLEESIIERDVAMVVLDPLMSAISDQLDTHVNRQVRQALDPLARMADRTQAVVAGIAHFNKSSGSDASNMINGSGAFKDVARFVFAFATDDDGTQVISQTKNSVGRRDLPSLAYRVIEALVETPKGTASTARFVMDGEAARSVDEILADQHTGDGDEQSRAQEFLGKALADGERLTTEVEEEARERFSLSKRTLERARKKLGVVAYQKPTGEPRKKGGAPTNQWWLSLPVEPHRQSASASPPSAVWRSGGLPSDQSANGHNTANQTANLKVAPTSADNQTATPPAPLEPGGLIRPAFQWGDGTIGEEASA